MQVLTRRTLLGHALASAAFLPVAAGAVQVQHVDIRATGFHPPRLQIRPGDRIIVTNAGDTRHSATADSGLFDTGPLAPGQTTQIICTWPGLHTYFCSVHPQMTGTLFIG